MHAFDGKARYAVEAAQRHGYYFSVPPSVVRSTSTQLHSVVKLLPPERLLLESDALALAPQPRERNEPANILVACQFIAQLRGVSFKEMARLTTDNARRLFTNLK